ncbi:MAG: LCP family protein [Bacillota bacterium]|nr:LCP family protein [Bacillota bacterium]
MKFFKRKAVKIPLIILCVILILLGGAYGYVRYTLGKITTVNLNKTPEELEVHPYQPSTSTTISTAEPTQPVKAPNIKNIALIGVDKANPDGSQRSDSVMVASIDMDHKKIKLTSFMRDSYIEEPGRGYSRMGHTYQDGGPVLTIQAINKNFELDVTDYVKVDFDGLISIVDSIGGVQITIKDYEVTPMSAVGINKAGKYNLNGKQALAYSRIRHYGDADYERTERQRDVIEQIFKKLTSQGTASMASTMTKLLPYVETSLTSSQIMDLGYQVVSEGIKTVEQSRVPYDDSVKTEYIKGVYYLTFDKDSTIQKLHKFIYED